uniref:Uncharacterized protein n=1 Tax=Sander lucioperca TaxID=283035 RepID=A0A8D0AF99_SANLU
MPPPTSPVAVHIHVCLDSNNICTEDFEAMLKKKCILWQNWMLHRHLQPGNTEDLYNHHSFKVGTQDKCHQFSSLALPDLPPQCCGGGSGESTQKCVFAEHFDVTVN